MRECVHKIINTYIKIYKYIFHLNLRILFLFGFYFCCWARNVCNLHKLLYHICLLGCSSCVFMVFTPEWTDWWDLLFVSRDSSNYSAVLCTCFQIAVCPHPIGRVLYTCIAWFQTEYAYQKYVFMYICVYSSIYPGGQIDGCMCVWIHPEWIQNKAVLWIVVRIEMLEEDESLW